MMKTWLFRIFLLAGYCIPFAFLAMYGDAAYGTMWLYGLLIAGFGALSIKAKHFSLVSLGNLLSFLSSHICLSYFSTEKWEWYFKPLTANRFLLALSAAAWVIQVWLLWHGRRRNGR